MRTELAAAIDALRPRVEGAAWVPPENLHATIAFLGRVEDERIDAIATAVRAAAGDRPAFETRLGALGAFPRPQHARVVWAGLDDAAGSFAEMAGSIQTALEPLGFEPDHRPYRAHITLARLKTPRRVDLDHTLEPVPFAVDRVVVFESKLGRPHATYLEREAAVLGG